MKLSRLLRDVNGGDLCGKPEREITGICSDSRRVGQGSLFVAIPGFQSDGHQYIRQAMEQGACAVVAQHAPDCPVSEGVTLILVDDARRALAQLAAEWYDHPERQLRLVGVTGTNGKTTTTWLIRHILEQRGHKCGLIGTNGSIVDGPLRPAERTTPEAPELYGLLREMADAGCEYAAMEVSSHSLVLERVHGLHFAAAAFTNLTQDHLDFHKDMEHYFQAKALLFQRCDTAVLNLDDDWGLRLAERVSCPRLTYSAKRLEADLIAKNIRLLPDQVQAVLVRDNDIARMRLNIPGMFSVYNGLTAIGCCLALGLTLEESAQALQSAQGICGRAEIVPTGRDFTVMIDYSHTPDSMENILRTVRGYARGRVVGLFGAGGDRDHAKRPIMGHIAGELCDLCVVTSDNPRSEEPEAIIRDILQGMSQKHKYKVIPDRREAIAWCIKNARKDDIIVLMGKGQETYQEIRGVKHHLDEREEVRRALEG
ncbi:MAG: UDP-N-acetylmuramoyl-L-alanyl-D-glutamate--2,6-diaminopimelate ligase [Clostridia bacterium]|nr:UDP-N-acetylmuramoyl-L-alanyl-D-glutamate--2,6-diaminopimelate ligase [Clostridia bacterium]